MVLVGAPGNRVTVIDVFPSDSEQAGSYNPLEEVRDPPHVRAPSQAELTGPCHDAEWRDLRTAFYRLEAKLEALLATSFSGDANRIRWRFANDLGAKRLGLGATLLDGTIYFPIVVIGGRREPAGE
jgi:hypothetical protein